MLERIGQRGRLLEKALDASWLRNETISQNMANEDTPGYKRKVVSFEKYLDSAVADRKIPLRRTDPRHIDPALANDDPTEIKVETDNESTSVRLDGNNVDIDNEAASMAKNTIKYNVLIQTLNAGYGKVKSAISEGRR